MALFHSHVDIVDYQLSKFGLSTAYYYYFG